jgi:hypothetical protein
MIFLCGTQDGDCNEYMTLGTTRVYTMFFRFLGKKCKVVPMLNSYTMEMYGGIDV